MTTHPVGVVDTSIAVLLGRPQAHELPGEPVISGLTLAELSGAPASPWTC